MPAFTPPAAGTLTTGLQAEKSAAVDPVSNAEIGAQQDEKSDDSGSDKAVIGDSELQHGVAKIEALASVWSKRDLYIAYIGIFLIFFMNSLQQQVTGNLTAYVTSAFAMHSLVSTIAIVSNIVGGVFKLPIAKLCDIWGRPEVFVIMLILTIIGLAMMASCKTVSVYAGAQVFYWVGFNGMSYVLNVFMADTSSIKNRALVFAFSTTPYIGTTFAGPALAQDFYQHSTWRWGHGVWTIIVPFFCLPFLTVVFRNQSKAKEAGLIKREKSNRTLAENISYYFWEFDVVGLALLSAGFVLVLLPMALANYQRNTWRSGTIIAMFVVGGLCLICFAIYEKFYSRKCFIPFELILDRTILGACALSATIFISFYCWDAYYSSYVQVVHNQSIENAGYIYNIYSIGSCFFAVIVGVIIKYTRRFKYITLCFGVPLYVLATGLMIHFRMSHVSIGYVVMCQIFIAFAGGVLVIAEQLAVMSTTKHQNVAAVLAVLGLCSSIGGGIGSAISGAIWTSTLPEELRKRLPDNIKSQYYEIYSSLPVQLSYAWGSREREAIISAYAATQRLMVIAATVVMAFSFIWVGVWRNIKLEQVKNTKGLVF
ncbi:major facilitator superfamily domain-containing protein [Sphaerosporella brunnea]|uniref:Major facilitator superfamily domain-containing protein n=1 Tax=Sphaerosporella brunnea TaxID=1250544 RepID=A0A5J5F4Q4_9PEZI|nr:major facilitator superfamily domain-containing protein [Sphaerosporella brunnea]